VLVSIKFKKPAFYTIWGGGWRSLDNVLIKNVLKHHAMNAYGEVDS
jgi:hypothetical protein